MGCTVAGLAESVVGFQSHRGMAAILPGGSLGGMLGYLAGVIKPGGALLAVLVGVVQALGPGESHLLTG